MDMVDLAKQNDGYQYIVVCINIFSRFARCVPLKTKKGKNVLQGLKTVFKDGFKVNIIRTDRGMEFRSKEVNAYLNSQNVHHFYALNTETKANYAERLENRTQRYIDVLQDIDHSYNHTLHHSLVATRASITEEKEGKSRLQQYLLRRGRTKWSTIPKKKARKIYKFKISQTVRLSHVRSVFDREYSQKWTGEIFKIGTRFRREGVPVYTILDWDNERVEGTFYEPELQAVDVDLNTEYHIDKIVKRRVRNKRKEVLVSWLHWPKKYNSWIPEADVKDYS